MNDKEFMEIARSIRFGGVKTFSNNSTTPIEEQKIQRIKHRKDLIQPREADGKINPEFIQEYGTKGLNLTKQDVMDVEKKIKKTTELDKKGIRNKINHDQTN